MTTTARTPVQRFLPVTLCHLKGVGQFQLRPLRPGDALPWFIIVTDPQLRPYFGRFQPQALVMPATIDDVDADLDVTIKAVNAGDSLSCAITTMRDQIFGRLMCRLNHKQRTVRIGLDVHPGYKGLGTATRTIAYTANCALLAGPTGLGFGAIHTETHPGNERMQKILRRLGFVENGEVYFDEGWKAPAQPYTLTASAWDDSEFRNTSSS